MVRKNSISSSFRAWKKNSLKKAESIFSAKKKKIAKKKKVISLKKNKRNNSHVIEINFSHSKVIDFVKTHQRPFILSGITVLIIALSSTSILSKTHADISKADLFPSSCLGSWQNPRQAEGLPDVPAGGSGFTKDNSAYASDKDQEIFCGNFQGDTPPDAVPKKFTLKLSWLIAASSVVPSIPVSDTGTPVIDQNSSSLPATNDAPILAPDANTSPATDSTPINTTDTSTPATDSTPINTTDTSTPATDSTPTVNSDQSVPVSDMPASDSQPAPVAPPASDAPAPTPTSETPAPAPVSDTPVSFLRRLFSVARAQDVSIPADAPTPTPTSSDSSSLPDSTAVVTVPADNLLEVRYTTDGSTWKVLGTVTADNWKDANFEINDSEIASFDDLSKLQVSVRTLPTNGTPPVVYLDSAYIEVSYETMALPQQVEGLPTIELSDSSIDLISGDSDFNINDTPAFVLNDPKLTREDVKTLVKDGKADIVSDPNNVLGDGQAGLIPPAPVIPSIPPLSIPSILAVPDTSSGEATVSSPILPSGTDFIDSLHAAIDSILPGDSTPSGTPAPLPDAIITAPSQAPVPDTSAPSDNQSAPVVPPSSPDASNTVSFFEQLFGVRHAVAQTTDQTASSTTDASSARVSDVTVFGPSGEVVDLGVTLSSVVVDGVAHPQVKIDKPQYSFKPGLYKIKITLATAETAIVSEQDFSWGVLTINTDRSIYSGGESAYIQMGVLDEKGHTLCGAKLDLSIRTPAGLTYGFHTSNASIVKDPQCGPDNVINVPDYYAHFTVPQVTGTYQMSLTATTDNGIRTIHDSFNVAPSATVPFDVVRTGPSRIYPIAEYPVGFAITPRRDFDGTITETVPADFEISTSTSGIAYDTVETQGSAKIISWHTHLNAGKKVNLGYRYNAPDISPDIFLLGPLRFYDTAATVLPDSIPVFQETREWQIASDAACVASATGDWETAATWGGTCNGGTFPDSTSAVTINSGVVVTVSHADAAASVEILNPSGGSNGITINTTKSLAISGALTLDANTSANNETVTLSGSGTLTTGTTTINANTSTGTATIAVATGTLTSSGLISIAGGGAGTGASSITFSTGTVTASAGVTFSGTTAQAKIAASGVGTFLLTGTMSGGGTYSANSSTLEIATAATINTSYSFSNVLIDLNAVLTLGANINVSGNWTNNSSAPPALTTPPTPPTFSGLSAGANTVLFNSTAAKVIQGDAGTPFGNLSIGTSSTITMTTSCTVSGNFVMNAATTNGAAFIQSGADLAITGNATINVPNNNAKTEYWRVNDGTASVAGTTTIGSATTGDGTRVAEIAITTGTLQLAGLTFGSGTSASEHAIDLTGGAGVLKISGAITSPGTGDILPGTTSTVVYNGSSAQTIPMPGAGGYANLQILNTNASGASLGAAITSSNVTGNLTVGDGTTAAVFDNGGFAMAGAGTATFENKNNATFIMSGTSTYPTGFGTFTYGSSSTTIYNQSGSATVSGQMYGNLTLKGSSSTYTLGGATTVAGNLDVNVSTSTLQLADKNFTVTGTTSVSGTLSDNNVTGSNLFTGAVEVKNGGTWTETNNPAYEFRGGLTVTSTSTFTSGSGAYTFSTNAQTIAGTQAFTITNLTNSITSGNGLTFSGANPTVTTLTQGTNAVLTFSGSLPTITTLNTTSNTPNTVQYTGSSQAVLSQTYSNLTINGTGTATTSGTTTVNGTLTLTSGLQQGASAVLNIAGSISGAGTLDASTNANTVDYTGTGQIVKAITYKTLTIDGTATNSGTVTVNTALSGSGTLTQGSGATLNIAGTSGITTLDASTNANTVDYTGTSQTVKAITYKTLTIDGTATNSGTVTVNTALSGSGTLTQGSSATLNIAGTSSGISALDASASGNTVVYNSTTAGQTIKVPSSSYANLTISNTGQTATLGGNTTVANVLTISSSATLAGSSFTLTLSGTTGTPFSNSGTFSAGTGTVSYTGNNSGGNTTVAGESYYNLTINNASETYVLGGTTSVNASGTLTVTAGTLDLSNQNFTDNNTASISGTLADNSATGTNIFVGLVTINSGGIWTTTNNPAFTFRGGLTENSSSGFTAGTGTYTFDTNAQNISGSQAFTIPNLTVTGITLTNLNTGGLTVSTALSGTGGLTQGSNAILTLGGTSGISTLTGSASGNLVTYTGASQAIKAATYNDLTVNGSGTATVDSATTVNGTMTVSSAVKNNATLTVTTALSGANTLTQGAGSTLNIAGTSGITTLDASTFANTVNYSGGAQTVKPITYSTLQLSGSGAKTVTSVTTINADFNMSGSATATTVITSIGGNASVTGTAAWTNGASLTTSSGIAGTLTIGTGASFNLAGFSATVTGATSITGTLQDSSASGTNIFVGAVTINSGGVWNNSGDASFTFRGGFARSGTGTFTGGTSGVYTFDTNSQTISGDANAFTIPNITNNVTNASGLILSTAYPTVTALTQGTNAVLVISGTVPTITTLTATASGNLVKYTTTASQAVIATTYNDLTLAGATPTIGGTTVVNGTMTVTGVTATNNSTLTVTTALSGTGTLAQGSSSTLNLGGTIDISTLTATASGNTVVYTGSGQTIFPTTYKNLTINATGTVSQGATITATGLVTVSGGTFATADNTLNAGSIVVSGGTFSPGSSTINLSGTTGTLFTWSGGSFGGDTSTVVLTSASGTPTVASGTPAFYNLTVNGDASATFNLGEDLSVASSLTVSSGTLDTTATAYGISTGALVLSGGVFKPRNSIVSLTGINTVYSYTSGTYSATGGPSTIKLTNASSSGKTFSGGGQTYGNIWFAAGTGTGTYTVVGSNTFSDFKDDGTVAHSILFTTGTTQTVSTWNVSGHSGQLITINSTTTGTHNLVKSGGGIISANYLNIQHSVATPLVTWFAGTTSTNNQNVTTAGSGWTFTAPPCVAVATGNWSSSGTWAGTCSGTGGKPGTGDAAAIQPSTTVTMDENSAALGDLSINGTLTTSDGTSRTLTASSIIISSGGTLTANASTINLSGTSGTLLANAGTFTQGTSAVTLTGTSGTPTVASGTPTFYDLTTNGSGGTFTLGETLTVTHSLTVAAGSLATANNTVNANTVTVSGGTYSPGSSTINLTGTGGATLFTFTSGTIATNSAPVNLTGSGDATVSTGTAGLTPAFSFYTLTSSGTGTKSLGEALSVAGALTVSNGTFDTGSDQAVSAGNIVLSGGTLSMHASPLSLSATTGTLIDASGGGTLSAYTGTVTVASASGTPTFTASLPAFVFANITGSGAATLGLGEALNVSGTLALSGTTLAPGANTITLSGTGTVFDFTSGGFTPGTSTIKLTDSSSSGKTFSGGGQTYNNIWFAPSAGTGSLTIAGSNTFNDFKDDGSVAHSILFTAGTTTSVTTFSVTGHAGALITLSSTTTGTYTLHKNGGGTISTDYLNVQHSIATPSSTWDAGSNSVNNQSVATAGSGWTFGTSIISVVISSNGTISYGTIPANTSKNTTASGLNTTPVATNDGSGTENFNIKGQDTACPWTLASTTAPDQYKHEFSTDGGSTYTPLTTGYQSLSSGIAASGTQNFDLKITTPTSSECTTSQSVDVTIEAVAP